MVSEIEVPYSTSAISPPSQREKKNHLKYIEDKQQIAFLKI